MNFFDLTFYKNFHLDLKSLNWSNKELLDHYQEYGYKEGRLASERDFYKLYPLFDLDFYNNNYEDLSVFNGDKYLLMWHYEEYGKKEGRICTKFDCIFYNNFHLDIKNLQLNENQIKESYQNYGKKEGRICGETDFYALYPNFDWCFYLSVYEDLNVFNGDKYFLMWHYHNFGFKENRICCEKDFYESSQNIKGEYRFFCFENMHIMKEISLPNFIENSFYESVLIEFRIFPHLELLIRNTIYKLGEKWSHSVICGNLNYTFMKTLCLSISPKIKVIKTNFENLFPSDYSKFLSSLEFWDLIHGEKILIYQEDTFLFKNNIEDFLQWDYIGAPWPSHQNDNKKGVGNGGFSLRSKSIMKKIINTVSIENTKFNSSTFVYIKNTDSYIPPEDVYFTRNMEYFNIGLLADKDTAFDFSTESLVNKDSLGGHQFWLNDPDWKNRLIENFSLLKTTFASKQENNQIQFCPHYDTSFLVHRGGWKSVLSELIKNQFFNNDSNIHFYDIIEANFLWGNETTQENQWAGIIHLTPDSPDHLKGLNLNTLFDKIIFKESLKQCRFLITLSTYISNFLKNKLSELNISVPVYTLKHPVETDDIPLFCYDKYINSKNKKILQIGQQLRKISSIYIINSSNHEKIWLTGNKDFNHCKFLIENDVEFRKINKNNLDKSVKMYYTETFEEYDELLSENIVFIDLYDAAANNTILECIIRNTPIIVNKIEPIVEYLGEDYPLYFHLLNEIPFLLKDQEKILAAHNYLSNLNKSDLSIEYFSKQLIDIAKSHFS